MMILVEGEVDHTRRRMGRGPWLHNNHKPQPIQAPGTGWSL